MPVRKPVTVNFGEQEDKELDNYVHENIVSLQNATKKLHKEKLPEWQKIYKGIPRDNERTFPWVGASNVVIQLAGENTDILKARLIASVYEILPLWTQKLLGEWNADEQGEEQRAGMEAFMDYVGLEPSHLDLYRVESLAANDIAQYGTVVVKTPWETLTEETVVDIDGTKQGAPNSTEITKYDGPRPEKLPLDAWAATPTSTTLEKAPFKWHWYPITKQTLLERSHKDIYDKASVAKIIGQPDRNGPREEERAKQEKQNIEVAQGNKYLAEWDMYECWFPYWHSGKKYRILYTMHLATKTRMRAVFNFYPDNDEPWDLGRLGYTDDGLYGYGFVEMLKYYQEEVTTGHNQRVDNRTLANTSIILTGNNNKLDAGFSIYPNAVLPFKPEDFETKQLGSVYPSSVDEERLTIELAKARCGVDQAQQGAGSAVQSKKGGLSAMGTFSTMQAGNSRININITDFRYLHLRIGRRCQTQYAEFGVGKMLEHFGNQARYIEKALENIKKKRLEVPIRAANASINRALEQQNGMLLTQVMQRHHSMIAQILQAINNPMMPPEMMEYLVGTIAASGQLMGRLLRNFNYDDITRLQPELELVKKIQEKQRSQQNGQQAGGGTPQAAGNQQPAFPQTGQEQGVSGSNLPI